MFDDWSVIDPLAPLLHAVDAVRAADDAVPGGIAGLTCARDSELLDLVDAAQAAVRSAAGILAMASGELSRRSQGDADASLARRLGEKNAVQLVAHRAGLAVHEAAQLVAVGEAVAARVALSGEDLPSKRPHLAEALAAGRLTVPLAAMIERTLASVAHLLWADQAELLERELVEKAASNAWSVADFVAFCKRIPNRLDPDGAGPRDDALKAKSSIRETELENGMLRIVAELDPESAGFYRAAMSARTDPRRSSGEGAGLGAADPTKPTPMQAKVDAFTAILRDSLRNDDGRTGGVDTTILVRIELKDLQSGVGTATIDGVAEPISAAAARRLAVGADLIPQVFDGRSVLLDQGESKRLFTKAQRYAILAMFIGCAFPKCDVPGSRTEIHHVGPWATRSSHKKGTDLLNGMPLCGFPPRQHGRHAAYAARRNRRRGPNRLMDQGWEVVFDEVHEPWFVPPATIDPSRTPLRGGNLAHQHAA